MPLTQSCAPAVGRAMREAVIIYLLTVFLATAAEPRLKPTGLPEGDRFVASCSKHDATAAEQASEMCWNYADCVATAMMQSKICFDRYQASCERDRGQIAFQAKRNCYRKARPSDVALGFRNAATKGSLDSLIRRVWAHKEQQFLEGQAKSGQPTNAGGYSRPSFQSPTAAPDPSRENREFNQYKSCLNSSSLGSCSK